jgi:hypothetical protein
VAPWRHDLSGGVVLRDPLFVQVVEFWLEVLREACLVFVVVKVQRAHGF